MTINFSGRHYPSDIIMMALHYYLAYKLSYREIEEVFVERNIHFAHLTLNRWVSKYRISEGLEKQQTNWVAGLKFLVLIDNTQRNNK